MYKVSTLQSGQIAMLHLHYRVALLWPSVVGRLVFSQIWIKKNTKTQVDQSQTSSKGKNACWDVVFLQVLSNWKLYFIGNPHTGILEACLNEVHEIQKSVDCKVNYFFRYISRIFHEVHEIVGGVSRGFMILINILIHQW